MSNCFRGSMGAMRRAECIIHKHVSVLRKFFCHLLTLGCILAGFFFMEAGVFQHNNLTLGRCACGKRIIGQYVYRRPCLQADCGRSEFHRFV